MKKKVPRENFRGKIEDSETIPKESSLAKAMEDEIDVEVINRPRMRRMRRSGKVTVPMVSPVPRRRRGGGA